MPEIFAIWSLSDGMVFLFLVTLLALPITDRWLGWSGKVLRGARIAQEDDIFFSVFIVGLFVICALEAKFGNFARFTAIVDYARAEDRILRENIVGVVVSLMLLGFIAGPLLCAWLARLRRRSIYKWVFYGVVTNWAGVVWLALNGSRDSKE